MAAMRDGQARGSCPIERLPGALDFGADDGFSTVLAAVRRRDECLRRVEGL